MKHPSIASQAKLPLPARGALSALTAPPATLVPHPPLPGVSQGCRTPAPPLILDPHPGSDHPALSGLPTRGSPSAVCEIELPSLIQTTWPTGFTRMPGGGGPEANPPVLEHRAVVTPQRPSLSLLLGETESVPDHSPTPDKQELGQGHAVQGPRGQAIMEWAGASRPASALDQQEAPEGSPLQQQVLEQMALQQEDRDEEDDEAQRSSAQVRADGAPAFIFISVIGAPQLCQP